MSNYQALLQGQENHTSTKLEQVYQQALEDERRLSIMSLIAACLAFVFLLGGILLVYIGYAQTGVLSALSSSLPGSFTALFSNQLKASKKRLDKFRNELIDEQKLLRHERINKEEWEQINTFISNIHNDDKRDIVISEVILQKFKIIKDTGLVGPKKQI